ncbi:hypothetical protein D9M73_279730 [compost metagenome]
MRPVSWALVRAWPLVTAVPSARVTLPRVGRPVTVMVRLSPSTSLGATRPRSVPTDSSLTVRPASAATGASLIGLTTKVTVPLATLLVSPWPSSTL